MWLMLYFVNINVSITMINHIFMATYIVNNPSLVSAYVIWMRYKL